MGQRGYHRYTDDDWRAAGRTIEQLQANGWPVFAECQSCGTRVWIQLEFIAFKLGARASLWGRADRCRVVGCLGRVTYHLKPPKAVAIIAMTAKRPG